jgi:uncharacterized protein (TIGR02677 family)
VDVSGVDVSGVDVSGDDARRLFRYVTGDEWRDYRAIMAVLAGTFFAEFTPDDVGLALSAAGVELDTEVVGDRLESLRGWGNITVSSSVGNPADLADYYRRRNRYLITRAGQEVHDLVERVLARVDEVRDVSTGRLRAVHDALADLEALDLDTVDPEVLADAVRAVFDPHTTFADEITQFFVAINQWQSRYDLSPDEFRFFAEVLVGYVGERLAEIERLSRPIGLRLRRLEPRLPTVVLRMEQGLAARVEQAGLQGAVTVSRVTGSRAEDWDHLRGWFVSRGPDSARLERLTRDAVAAIRTLTLNLTRLSRVGVGAASRRADFLRLASWFDSADPDVVDGLVAAALGLHPTSHYGAPIDDEADATASTSWWTAPRAAVPVSIRERGDTTNRGRASPMPDRHQQQRLVRRRREQEQAAREAVDHELASLGDLDGAEVSAAALARLQQLIGRTSAGAATAATVRGGVDGRLRCTVRRIPGATTVVHAPHGTLTFIDLDITVDAAPSRPSAVEPRADPLTPESSRGRR